MRVHNVMPVPNCKIGLSEGGPGWGMRNKAAPTPRQESPGGERRLLLARGVDVVIIPSRRRVARCVRRGLSRRPVTSGRRQTRGSQAKKVSKVSWPARSRLVPNVENTVMLFCSF